MSAGFRAFRHYGVRACFFHHPRHCHACHNGDDFYPGFFPHPDIGRRVASACGDCRYALLHNDFSHFGGVGVHQHDVDAERAVCQFFYLADLLPHDFGRSARRADNPEAARF